MARTLCLTKLHYGLTFMLFVCMLVSDHYICLCVTTSKCLTSRDLEEVGLSQLIEVKFVNHTHKSPEFVGDFTF